MKTKFVISFLFIAIILFLISCAEVSGKISEAVEEAAKETIEKVEEKEEISEKIEEAEEIEEIIKEPIEEVELLSPTPEEGCGNVAGRVFWNSKPVNGANLYLCEKFEIFSGCEGEKYGSTSYEKGVFIIQNVPAGKYALIFQLPGEERYLFAGNFLKGATKVEVEEGKTLPLENIHAFKSDLELTTPYDKEEIDARNPTLSWEAYESAEYYLIYLTPERGDIGKLLDEKIEEVNYQLKTSLLNCKFTWKVEALNEYGRKIAESEYFNFFVKADCPTCYLELLSPGDKEKISEGTPITLSWEDHPLAEKYNLYLENKTTYEYIVRFVKIDETSYEISQSMPEGEYYWGVFVEDSFGTNVAQGSAYFTVIK